MRLSALLLLLFVPLSLSAQEKTTSYIAIIIDDLGNDYGLANKAIQLPGQITYAVLPQLGLSKKIAKQIHAKGKEVMLHLPMETLTQNPTGPGGLHHKLDREAFNATLEANLASVPHLSGVNNHMGSLLTAKQGQMDCLMTTLQQKQLYFIDSRTTVETVAQSRAEASGIATSRRDVFLDNERNPAYIKGQIKQLLRKAKRTGSAIAIGHPYPETLDVLSTLLPTLAEKGYELVPVSQLLVHQGNKQLWLKSSSPSPKVAKN